MGVDAKDRSTIEQYFPFAKSAARALRPNIPTAGINRSYGTVEVRPDANFERTANFYHVRIHRVVRCRLGM